MTDNQSRAIQELVQYREAKKDIDYHRQQIQVIESKVNRATRACDTLMQQTLVNGVYVSVPVAVKGGSGRNPAEDLLDTLMDMRVENLERQAEAERICRTLENNIFDRLSGSYARILSKLYLYNMSLEKISVSEKYSFRQTLRRKWKALEIYGEKMALDVT